MTHPPREPVICDRCGKTLPGRGLRSAHTCNPIGTTCPTCNGRGTKWRFTHVCVGRGRCPDYSESTTWKDCPTCHGAGVVRKEEGDIVRGPRANVVCIDGEWRDIAEHKEPERG